MGASNSRPRFPVLSKCTEGGETARIRYAASSMQGWRPKMEDARAAVPELDHLTSFFGVYDGHGGAEVALLCAKQFHIQLRNQPDYQRNLYGAIWSSFFRMDELMQRSDDWRDLVKPRGIIDWIRTGVCANHLPFTQARPYIPPQYTGSTACVAAIKGNRLIVGNVGDSRCVVSKNGQAIELSTDHKPNVRAERERIHRAGGQVTRDSVLVVEGGRVQGWQRLDTHRINGLLSVSRVIGDFAFKRNVDLPLTRQLAPCHPDVESMEITNDIEFFVIASDGLWECMTSQHVVDFVRKYLRSGVNDLKFICERLCDRALPSTDNVTVVLVQFKDTQKPPPLTESEVDDNEGQGGDGDDDDNNNPRLPPLVEDDEASEEMPPLLDDEITEVQPPHQGDEITEEQAPLLGDEITIE